MERGLGSPWGTARQPQPQWSAQPPEGGETWDCPAGEGGEKRQGGDRTVGGRGREKRARAKIQSQKERKAGESNRERRKDSRDNKNNAHTRRMRTADSGELAGASPLARPADGGIVSIPLPQPLSSLSDFPKGLGLGPSQARTLGRTGVLIIAAVAEECAGR